MPALSMTSVQFFAFNTAIAKELNERIQALAKAEAKAARHDPNPPFTPSAYQARIFEWLAKGKGSAIVRAVAGSGKTTTCINGLRYIPGIDLANARASTFHSAGFSTLRRKLGNSINVDSRKMWHVLNTRVDSKELSPEELDLYGAFVVKLVSYAKGEGIGALEPDAPEAWERLIDHYDLSLDSEDASEERAIALARQALTWSNEIAESERLIDFDDQLYLPLLWRLKFWQNDFVIVDESQDTNPVRRAIIKLALRPGGRLMAVGDECQPVGTLVEKAEKSGRFNVHRRHLVPIETLEVGDYVTAFNFKDSRAYARKILGKTTRTIAETLISVTAMGKTSRYTQNHICLARHRKHWYCTYLMKRGNTFRVGMSALWNKQVGAGPLLRLRAEDADALWILDVFPTRREAIIAEQAVTIRYGLPQLMFTEKSGALITQAALDQLWANIDNTEKAKGALAAFGRLLEYPYFTKQDNLHASLKRPHRVRACNLLRSSEVMLRDGTWAESEIGQEVFSGEVVSLDVEKEHNYFADGILTHNCQSVYGFTGASTDAMKLIKQEFSCIDLPLTVSYRCSKAVIERAQTLVPYIEAAPGAKQGSVSELPLVDTLAMLSDKDAILCRNTAPLLELAFQIIAQGRGCFVAGRDIGRGLIGLIEKQKAKGIERLLEKLAAYQEREVAKFTAKGEEHKAESLSDRIDCIRIVIKHLPETSRTIPALVAKIESMFSDNGNNLTLSTMHKSKGREWNNVAIYRPELCPSRWARQEWQQEQERNLLYVAWTRAKVNLIEIEEPPQER